MILYVSDFDLSGSGYMRIGTNLCSELVLRHELGVIALGLGYDGREHRYPFSITPAQHLQQIPTMVQQIRQYGAPLEAIVVALDIPLQEALMKALKVPGDVPYVGIFPLEAGPLCLPWAMELMRMNARLVMSRFGQEELKKVGVESEFIPIGIDTADGLWRPPTPEERAQIRHGLGWDDETFIILTVADNQERKNLAGGMHIIKHLVECGRKVQWHLVTRVDSSVGWKLEDLAMRLGIMPQVMLYQRGVPPPSLWAMFAGADAFLLTSKAEGLAIPVMEAMAVKLPVVATDCTAMAEHLAGGRGLLIQPEYQYVDPFGNGDRWMVNPLDGADLLCLLMDDGPKHMALDDAYQYVAGRTWQQAGDVLAETIRSVKKVERQEEIPQAISESVGAPAPVAA